MAEYYIAYDEYCLECYCTGRTPKSFWAWYHEGEWAK